MADIAAILIDLPVETRPPWFNLFLSMGTITFLAKTHMLRLFCKTISTQNSDAKKERYLRTTSLTMGTVRIITYLYILIKNHFITEILSRSTRYKIESLITFFASGIYSLSLIIFPLIEAINKLKKKELPKHILPEIKLFMLYGIVPKVVLDSIQAQTVGRIQAMLFGASQPVFTKSTLHITCILSTIYFFIIYTAAKKIIKKASLPQFLEGEPENLQIDATKIKIPNPDIYDIYIEKTILFSAKNSIAKAIKYNLDAIKIFSNKSSSFDHNPQSGIKQLLEGEEIKKILNKNGALITSNLETIAIIQNDIAAKELFEKLQKEKIEAIIPWLQKGELEGAIILQTTEDTRDISQQEINICLRYAMSLKIFYTNYSYNLIRNSHLFKAKSIQEKYARISYLQQETFYTVLKSFNQCKIVIAIYNNEELKYNTSNTLNSEIVKKAILDSCKKTLKNKQIIQLQGKTENEKSYKLFSFPPTMLIKDPHAIVLIFDTYLPEITVSQENRTETLFLNFTHTGFILNKLLPGKNNNLMKFKEELIKLSLSGGPLLLVLPPTQAENIIKMISYVENLQPEIIMCSEEKYFTRNLFEKFILHDQELKPYIKTINSSSCAAFINIDALEDEAQNNIMQFCLSGDNQYIKNTTPPKKFIFTIQNISYLAYLNQTILQNSEIINIYNPPINELNIKEIYELFEGLNLLYKFENFEYIMHTEENFKKLCRTIYTTSWTLFDAIENFKYYNPQNEYELAEVNTQPLFFDPAQLITSSDEKDIIKLALFLGKESLNNNELLEQLLKICKNQTEIASLIGVHKSSVTRAIQKIQKNNQNNER